MTASEASQIVGLIEATWDHEVSDATRAAWMRLIADLGYAEAEAAVARLGVTFRYRRPMISDLVAEVMAGRPGPPDGLAAWEAVCRSIAAGGWNGDHSNVPELAREVARQIGWEAIGLSSSQDTWMQRHFIRAYEARAERLGRQEQIGALGGGEGLAELAGEMLAHPALGEGSR